MRAEDPTKRADRSGMAQVVGGWRKRRTAWLRATAVLAAVGFAAGTGFSETGSTQTGLTQTEFAQTGPMQSGLTKSVSGLIGIVKPGDADSERVSVAQASPDLAAKTAAKTSVKSSASLRFLRGRSSGNGVAAARGLAAANAQHARMVHAQGLLPPISALNVAWQPVGPGQVASAAYGKITGRVSSIAIDPSDRTGNTVYVGTTGGGVWKSTSAAGIAEGVGFTPLTDNLPVFSGNAGSSARASLSIGAISAQVGGIVLAGTGDPNDASDSYYGSGILRSADGGLSWTLIETSQDGNTGLHSFRGLGFAGFAWSTVNPSLVVAALSQSVEGTIVHAPTTNSVMGLYVSIDAGVTWQMATISDGSQTVQMPMGAGGNGGGLAASAVVWNPIRRRFYAVVRYHGYYESINGMQWTRLAAQPGLAMTLEKCPSAPGTSGSPSCPVFRGALAVQPDTGDTFALTTDRNNIDQGLWRDVCGLSAGSCSGSAMSFGRRLPSGALEAGSGSAVIPQADYNLSLSAVSASADTLLFVGTSDLYRCSLADGCVLRNTTNATNGCAAPAKVAPAQHAIATLAAPALLFLGNDGGLWRSTDEVSQTEAPCSTDDANHFQNLNAGLGSLAEVISFAQDAQDPASLLVGLGASGTASSIADASGAWPQISAGEGGTVAIDQSNPLLWYISTAGGVSLHGCSLGKRCMAGDFAGPPTIGAVQTSADASVIDPPWLLDPAMSSNVVIGTCRVWRGMAASGAQWSGANRLSTTLGGPQNSACDPATNPFLRSLAAGGPSANGGTAQNSGSRVLYAGMAGSIDGGGVFAGHIFTTFSADVASNTTRWTDLAASPVTNDFTNAGLFNPGGFDISSLAADPHDATGKTIYATVMGFSQPGLSTAHVYASTDGGAHWLNVSSNLPDAPANSVAVDPNDANTLYVAMDTGVYATTNVTNCSTANCWSVYGVSLPNAPAVQLSAAALMPTEDGRTGLLRVGTYGRGIWQIPLLTASYAVKPAITLSPESLSFGDQPVGTISSVQTIVVTNTGNAPLGVSRTAVTGDFSVSDNCVGAAIAVNASCTLQVQFLPGAQGARTGVLTVYANVSGGQATAAVSGNGTVAGSIVLTPVALTFPTTTINATSAAQNITVSNLGSVPVTLQTPSITGDFRISANTCGSSLGASTGCTVSITFSPTSGGVRSGALTMAGSTGTETASLTGTATTPATDAISPASLAFAVQQLGTISTTQQVVLTNVGDVPLTLIAAQISSGDFIAVNGCGNSLNPHSTCSINVAYAPKSLGVGSGSLVVSDQYRSQTVSLSGTGVAPAGVSLSPFGSMVFPTTAIGTGSLAQVVTLTNNGGVLLNVQGVLLSGDFAMAPGGTCGTTLAPSSACTFPVIFAPLSGGTRNGALVIADDAPNSPHTLVLTGMGIDFALAADGSTSATVASGKSAVYPLLLNTVGTTSGMATFTCTGAPANSTCVVSPGSATLGPSTLLTVTVATGVSSTALQTEGPGTHSKGMSIFLAGMLPFGVFVLRRRRGARLMGLLAVMCVAGGGGCGSGRLIPGAGGVGPVAGASTPTGSYTMTVAATASGLTRTITLGLTVQ